MKFSQKTRAEIGSRFGKLLVIGPTFIIPGKKKPNKKIAYRPMVVCYCDCGQITCADVPNLVKPKGTRSCGCKKKETFPSLTHGLVRKDGKLRRLYSTWRNMNSRCYEEAYGTYKHYGKRGIRVCDEWRHNPKTFADWALANGYKQDLTIDRIDNDGDYSPENCRWIPNGENVAKRFIDRDGKIASLRKTNDFLLLVLSLLLNQQAA